MSPFLKRILDVFIYRPEASNDQLEAYPERMHVEALPERRYLKTTRVLVIAALLSLAFNFAMCFIFIRNARNVEAIVENSNSQDTYLYYLDYYRKELQPLQKTYRYLNVMDLIFQNLISDYLNQRFQITLNKGEMNSRWGVGGKVYAYARKLYENEFLPSVDASLELMNRGITQDVYIYDIKNLNGVNFYEVVFDVFSLNESGYRAQKCPCRAKTKECLTCMRDTALKTIRYKAYIRVNLDLPEERSTEFVRENINPYSFNIESIYFLPQEIRPNDVWADVDAILN
ncbi:MAG: hypothetical protein E7013_05965 [Alphaproteobacteria bacterium]|nr:hypothetical protein [Alphaproteobacteria bacterium]